RVAEEAPFQPNRDRAAVALVLAGEEESLELCFIQRVERAGDPWSGHIAFPGGRASAGDLTARSVAAREAREEVGRVLRDEQLLGALPPMPVLVGRVSASMTLAPFVYYAGAIPRPLTPNHEVAEAYWARLEELWDTGNGTRFAVTRNGATLEFPA